MLDGHHALYKVGRQMEEHGMVVLLQPGLTCASLNDDCLGQILDALAMRVRCGDKRTKECGLHGGSSSPMRSYNVLGMCTHGDFTMVS